jgi:hypothetical protein
MNFATSMTSIKIVLSSILVLLVFVWTRKLIRSLNPKSGLTSRLSKRCLAAVLNETEKKLKRGDFTESESLKIRNYLVSQKRGLLILTSGYASLVISKQGQKIPAEIYNDIIVSWVSVICPVIYIASSSGNDIMKEFERTMKELDAEGPLSPSGLRFLGLD